MKTIKVLMAACIAALGCLNAQAQNENEVDANCGQFVTITATPTSGYRFVRWSDETDAASSVGASRVIEVDASFQPLTVITAIFEANEFAVTAATNNEEWGTVTGAATAAFGAQITLKAEPTSACYRFVRWDDEDASVTSVGAERTVTVNANNNHYIAIFEQVSFRVQVASENAAWGTVTISKQ